MATYIIGALIALAFAVAASPVVLLDLIIVSYNSTMGKSFMFNSSQSDRSKDAEEMIKKSVADAKKNPVKEICTLIENYNQPVTPAKKESDNIIDEAFSNLSTLLQESKDFANSKDIKDIIDAYKAEQNKGAGKFRRVIERIYVKNPESIIDETPHILEFIRTFGILGTVAIHPAVAVVLFATDKIIEMGLKRKDTERVFKYFTSEKAKVEKLAEKSSGEKKERYEEYLKCLDKCLDKIEEYRNDLYSDDELEKMNRIDEAASCGLFDKIPVDDYFKNCHSNVIKNVDRACQIFKDGVFRHTMGIHNELENINLTPYTYSEDECLSTTLKNSDKEFFISHFVSPDGIINIPLYKFKQHKTDKEIGVIADICASVNNYLDKKCLVTQFDMNGMTYILFNYLECLSIEEESDFCYTEEIREAFTNIALMEEAVDIISDIDIDTLNTELSKNIEALCKTDIQTIAINVKESYVDTNKFTVALEDYLNVLEDQYSLKALNIKSSINILKENPELQLDDLRKAYVEADATAFLDSVLQEIKVVDKGKDAVQSVKTKMAEQKKNASKNMKDAKVKTNARLGLTTQAIKKGAQNLSLKEKEISKSIDVQSAYMKKNIEKALTTDRREAVIKGSIIPSFSKIIKSAIVIGAAATIFNPAVAAIGTIGALACSKKLTDKERQLLLDEIEIELATIEKEISKAESDGKMKEYKALLTYQRKLQREQQRIKYRLKLYNKEIPEVKGRD